MMLRKRLTFLPLLGVALMPLFIGRPAASEPAQKFLAVLEFKGANLKADILDTMSDAVRGGASDALAGTGINVMTRESMLVLLKEMGIKECTEGDCEVETARNIGSDYVISGRIVQMDGSYVATLKLHETKRGTLLGTRDAEAEKQKDLWHALKEQGRKLVAEKLVARPNPPAVATPPQVVSNCASNQRSIPGGTFWMGSEDGDSDEKPLHKVTLSPYCMDKTEVTVAAYHACVQARECWPGNSTVEQNEYSSENKTMRSQFCTWGKAGLEQHPLNCVDWNQAKAYCEWVGGRLPTEAEWEFAARGNDDRKFPWGNEEPGASRLNACGSECVSMAKQRLGKTWRPMFNSDDGWLATAVVGSLPKGASPFGVLDMAGNVWEWTADSYAPYSADAQKDPRRPGPDAALRVNRGGGWGDNDPFVVRTASRYKDRPGVRSIVLGFRCVRGSDM
jgi:formylglycine-generating enzyme required for sulfatase activity